MAQRRPLARALPTAAVIVVGVALAVLAVQASSEPRSQAAPPTAVASAAPRMAEAAPNARPAREQVRTPAGDVDRPLTANRLAAAWGVDVSWPQCDPGALPALPIGFVVVGVNGGRPFTGNPCLADQVAYAKAHTGYSAYLNIDAPRGVDPASYGRRVALDGLARTLAAGLRTPVLWLDVEVLNHWADPATNVAVIAAAMRALEARGVTPGIYSSQEMWQQITGGANPNTLVWLATNVTDYRRLGPWCASGLGGHRATMTQYLGVTGRQLIDVDVLCKQSLPDSVRLFAAGRGGR